MSNILLDFLAENPGIADYMDLSTGSIYKFGTTNTEEYTEEVLLQDILDNFKKEDDFSFIKCIGFVDNLSYYCEVSLRDKNYNVLIKDYRPLSQLVNTKDTTTLRDAMANISLSFDAKLNQNQLAKLCLHMCAGF